MIGLFFLSLGLSLRRQMHNNAKTMQVARASSLQRHQLRWISHISYAGPKVPVYSPTASEGYFSVARELQTCCMINPYPAYVAVVKRPPNG